MKTIDRRIAKLEDQFGTADGRPQLLLVVSRSGCGLALDRETCVQILDKCGFLPIGPVGGVNLGNIPNILRAAETESFLRGRGAEICFPRGGTCGGA